ncbi:ABC transporter substrate-binding protein [Modestobacter marinus]|uniref:ABC transporter substrate-binding protein n=1 Tax=Modestobacter marinus TaxID=477641 RepID=A0A846LMT0_9ACTN|nr:ABC transporter substrate-binding protein [Modestobacter marinus]NIH68731.1 peptide/nickel transport system substrate-binding protein [Modestobacter marinus]GGL59667.1 ABC transporter substrate-binding protein [Modestobacter marinus]
MSRAAGALLALPLLLAGCFAPAAEEPTDGGQRLALALAFPPVAALSPFTEDALLLTRMGVAETLVGLDETGAPTPLLAESWDRVDDRTVTLDLRDGVRFHDGTPLDAEAAAGALTTAAAASPAPRSIDGLGLTATAVDEDTVQVQLAEPDPLLVQRLAAPGMVVLAPAAYTDPTAPDPVGTGTGPFELTELRGASGATLTADPDHWAGAPELDGVDVTFPADAAARTAGLRAGELDVAVTLPIAQLPTLTDTEVLSVPLPRLVSLSLDTADGPFADPGLRAAAAAAIDPQPVVDGVFEGRADVAEGLFTDDTVGGASRPAVSLPPATDPAGTSIRLATYSDRAELPEAAAVLAEQLRQAGFTVEVVVAEYAALETDLLAGTYDAVLGSRLYLGDTGDPVGYLAADLTCEGSYNLARLCDPAVDAAVAEAAALADPQERRAAALAAEARVLSTGAVVPVLHERTHTGYAPGVSGLAGDPFDRRLLTVETTVQG